MTASIFTVGDKLVVGALDVSFLSASSRLFPGTTVLNGPVFIGLSASLGVARATCMIGPPIGISVPASLEVSGVSNFLGNTNQLGAYTCTGAAIFNGSMTNNGITVKNGNLTVNASQVINGSLVVNGSTTINGFLTFSGSIVGVTKDFDIPHPTKSDHRLKHGCLEGPEYSVFYRGRLINNNLIELPEYWRGLVDSETITVNLTPHSFYQELYVKSIEWGTKIHIVNNAGGQIDCSYVVVAERKDVAKLVVEYQGKEPKENSSINL
jgi:hypothetical protein